MIDSTDLMLEPDGATPLGPDELVGLIPTWVSSRGELNAVEQENIIEAMYWAFGQEWALESLLSDESIRQLHRRMFHDVWEWAGEYRLRETSIGVAPSQIAVQLRNLLADARARIESAKDPVDAADEIAVWFHHRLVQIHPFLNGNGRHARLAADLLVVALGGKRFTWGGADLSGAGDARSEYLGALRKADADFDCGPLRAFARS
ncbi:MAG: mobile mystery protein B [Coriobacteriia bacterium]|nr:mobile mystery protein B [Coriobacteriia bacterium]